MVYISDMFGILSLYLRVKIPSKSALSFEFVRDYPEVSFVTGTVYTNTYFHLYKVKIFHLDTANEHCNFIYLHRYLRHKLPSNDQANN